MMEIDLYKLPKDFSRMNVKGYGLVEALIAMLIISTTMISAFSMIARSFITVKEDEVRDRASYVMLRALEFGNAYDQLALPSEVNNELSSANANPFFKCYSFDGQLSPDDSNITDNLQYKGDNCTPITSCDTSNPYYTPFEGMFICNQIIFTTQNLEGVEMTDKIRITSIGAYVVGTKVETSRIDTFRNRAYN